MTTTPTKKQIRVQLEKLVQSQEFASSPRKQKFLRYIVEQALDGHTDRLKGYSIGVDVFERGAGFDPQVDTIVRVQARNLRKAVDLYYLTHGQDDPVRIEVPKGSYVPVFSLTDPAPALAALEHNAKQEAPATGLNSFLSFWYDKKSWSRPLGLIAFFVVVALSSAVLMRGSHERNVEFVTAAAMPTGPTVSIVPFDIVGDETVTIKGVSIKDLRTGLHVELAGKISRFRDLFVRTLPAAGANSDAKDMGAPEMQYVLTGSIQSIGDDLRVSSVLTRAATGEIIWTKSFDVIPDRGVSFLEIQSAIAVDVATNLGQPYSSLNTKFMAEHTLLSDMQLEHYYCMMQFYTYSKGKSEAEHGRTRDCLEKATTEIPKYSSAWAALSWMYSDEQHNRFNVRDNDTPPEQRALEAAQRAVAADPQNAMAYQYLAIAKFKLGDDMGFLEAAETALELNPNDPEVLADVGNHLIQMENSDRGQEMVEKAMALNLAHPAWYHGSIIMYYYGREDTETALFHAREFIQDDSLMAHTLLTATLVQDGQLREAKRALHTLNQKYPHFVEEYRYLIGESWRLPAGIPDQLLGDLAAAGLSGAL